MRLFARTIILLFVTLSVCYGGENPNADYSWLFDHYFKSAPKFKDELIQLDQFLIQGKYEQLKSNIKRMHGKWKDPLQNAAISCYEAAIIYNESDYKKSIQICDDALSKINEREHSRYYFKLLNFKAKGLGALNKYDQGKKILREVIKKSKKNGDLNSLSAAIYYLGTYYSDKGDFPKCQLLIQQSLQLKLRIGDALGSAACYSFIGLAYSYQDNYLKGIENIQKSIVIREKFGDIRGLANSYLTLYKVYYELGEDKKAMASEFQSLVICKKLGDQQCVSGRYTNIGQLYQRRGEPKKAMYFHRKALVISKELGIGNREALVFENIARTLHDMGYSQLALKNLDSSNIIRTNIGDETGITNVLLVKSRILLDLGKSREAADLARIAEEKAKSLSLPHLVKESLLLRYEGEFKIGDEVSALRHFKAFSELKDSILDLDRSRDVLRRELEFKFNKERTIEKLKQIRAQERTKQRENVIRYGIIILLLLIALLVFSFWQYRLKNKSKIELEITNTELISTNFELVNKRNIIANQNDTIQQKNKEITDSIHYAGRIQKAVLPDIEDFKNYLPDSFIFFRPKDIVSGDFYWVTQLDDKLIYIIADCTGHGVPGGFMSMLGVSLLNEIILSNRVSNPAEILEMMREKVIAALKQKGNYGEQKDGMDMAVISLDLDKMKMEYASANAFFYVCGPDGNLEECRGNHFPVGIYGDAAQKFELFHRNLTKGETIYSFTDGYADQFGGEKNKKFMYRRLRDLITENHHLQIDDQKEIFEQTLIDWMGDYEQIDDICLIGVHIPIIPR